MRSPRLRAWPAALASVLIAGLALVVAPAPSYAAPTLTTKAGNVVLYDQCQSLPIDYAVDLDGATAYRLQLQVFDPNGFTSQGFVVNTASGGKSSGTVSMTFCGSEAPGTWTIKGSACISFSCFLDQQIPLQSSTFEVRKAQTQTALRTKKAKRGGYTLIARVDREEPGGYAPSQGIFVQFQRLVGDQWIPVVRRGTSTVDGVAKLSRGLPRGTRVRAVVPDANNYSGSVSRSLRLKR